MSIFRVDKDGRPAGGESASTGIRISWQNGPLGRGKDRMPPNGAFVETVIAIARDRLQWYQQGEFACVENEIAIANLTDALHALEARTQRRELKGVEGTHET